MKYYIDCEFDGHGGPLLSLALVREDGVSAHIRTTARATDDWVCVNVEPFMDRHGANVSVEVLPYFVGTEIRRFLGADEAPVIIADSPVDIWRFCAALSTSEAGGWASADYPRMTFEVHNVDAYPTELVGAVQHNAWWDAKALKHKLTAKPNGGVIALKYFLDQVAEGTEIHMLFVVPNQDARARLQLDMFNAASERGLCPIWRSTNRTMIFGNAIAALRIAHEELHRELQGTKWHAIHGLDYLDRFENAYDIKGALQALVRS